MNWGFSRGDQDRKREENIRKILSKYMNYLSFLLYMSYLKFLMREITIFTSDVQYTLYNVHCTVYTVKCALYSELLHFTVYSV